MRKLVLSLTLLFAMFFANIALASTNETNRIYENEQIVQNDNIQSVEAGFSVETEDDVIIILVDTDGDGKVDEVWIIVV